MKVVFACLGGLLVGVALGAQGNVVSEVDRTHERFMEATRSRDTAAFASVVTDDFQVIPPDGSVSTKAQRLDELKRGEGIGAGAVGLTELRKRADYKVRTYGDAAIVTWVNPPNPPDTPKGTRMTRVLVKTAGGWRVAHTQQTPIR
jgi:ketosteroid isomerase-like protein